MRSVTIKVNAKRFKERLNIRNGKDSTIPGPSGMPGKPGEKGENGKVPAHRWEGTKLQFQNPDGSWGELVELRGKDGKGSKQKKHGGGSSKNTLYYDLTSQCNGVTKTFTVPVNTRILSVHGTQFPQNYRPDIDWTGSGTTTLTLTSEVGAPETGQTLFILYVEA